MTTASNSSVASIDRPSVAPEPAVVHAQPLTVGAFALPPCPAAPVVATPPVPNDPPAAD